MIRKSGIHHGVMTPEEHFGHQTEIIYSKTPVSIIIRGQTVVSLIADIDYVTQMICSSTIRCRIHQTGETPRLYMKTPVQYAISLVTRGITPRGQRVLTMVLHINPTWDAVSLVV